MTREEGSRSTSKDNTEAQNGPIGQGSGPVRESRPATLSHPVWGTFQQPQGVSARALHTVWPLALTTLNQLGSTGNAQRTALKHEPGLGKEDDD